jgi:hypothetical protein
MSPLRWYEILLLKFLAHSPRIYRITVTQIDPPEDDYDDEAEETIDDVVSHLEEMYHAPSTDDRREG